jgi:hypothetical protein
MSLALVPLEEMSLKLISLKHRSAHPQKNVIRTDATRPKVPKV